MTPPASRLPPPALRGLYAITSAELCTDASRLMVCVEAALHGGARLLQYRDKHNSQELRQRQAGVLVTLCHHFGVALIVNDDIDLAQAIGADGVHLGNRDAPVETARNRLGPDAIIGVSCGPSLQRARAAAVAGASYLAFGRFFPSHTKPQAPQADIEVLRIARAEFELPLCAIGGLTPDNAAPLITAGAGLIAAVDGVFGTSDVRAAAAAYAALFH